MSAYGIILNIHETSALFVCVVSMAAVVAHANAMAWCPLKPSQRWPLWRTIGVGIATGGFVDLARITSPWQEEMLERLAGATAIIGGRGTLAPDPRADQPADRPTGRHHGGLARSQTDVPSLPSQANDRDWLGRMRCMRAHHPGAPAGAGTRKAEDWILTEGRRPQPRPRRGGWEMPGPLDRTRCFPRSRQEPRKTPVRPTSKEFLV